MSRSDEEYWTQRSYFQFLAENPVDPRLALTFHIPNGGKRTFREQVRLKGTGMLAGVWDVFNPCSNDVFKGLWLEFKSSTGKLSKQQKWFGLEMAKEGYMVAVTDDWVHAARVTFDYFSLRYPRTLDAAIKYPRG